MGNIILITGGVIYVLALATNPAQAVKLGVASVSILGFTFVAVKMTEPINKNASAIIQFSGWSLSATALVGIIKLAMNGIGTVGGKIAGFFDWITFWN